MAACNPLAAVPAADLGDLGSSSEDGIDANHHSWGKGLCNFCVLPSNDLLVLPVNYAIVEEEGMVRIGSTDGGKPFILACVEGFHHI